MPSRQNSHDSSANPWTEWAQMTGWHGILDFIYAKTILLKIVWALILALGCFFAANQSYTLLFDYLTSDKWITTVTYESPPDGVQVWPNFTLCNLNWLAESKLDRQNLRQEPDAIEYAANKEEGVIFYYDMLNRSVGKSDDYKDFVINSNNTNMHVLMEKLAQTCDDTMLACGYSREFDLSKSISGADCCANSNASSGYSCFKMNTASIFKKRSRVEAEGYQAGIYFLLDARPSDDYENVLYKEKPSAGFKITLYYGDDDTDPLNPTLFVGTASHAVASISASTTRTKSRRVAQTGVQFYAAAALPCRDYTDYAYIDSSVYTKALCDDDCEAHYMMDVCNCTPQYVNLKNGSVCTGQQFECSKVYTELNNSSNKRFSLTQKGFDISLCKADCREPCDYKTISAKLSSAEFAPRMKLKSLTTYISRALNRNFTECDAANLTLLEIYYETDRVKIVEKIERISADELISNIGGSLGVWTGISIISIFQAFLYITFGTRALIARLAAGTKPTRVRKMHTTTF